LVWGAAVNTSPNKFLEAGIARDIMQKETLAFY